jgi:hypothetical protein
LTVLHLGKNHQSWVSSTSFMRKDG